MADIDPAMIRAKEAAEGELLSRPGVTAVDIGFKYVGGRRTDTIAIRAHVRHKGDVPAGQRVPVAIEGYPTDVIEGDYRPHNGVCANSVDPGRYATLQGGISGGVVGTFGGLPWVGTLGLVLSSSEIQGYWMLTNQHVLSPDGSDTTDTLVVQPGIPDGGQQPQDWIGEVTLLILAGSGGANVDCGLVEIGNMRAVSPTIAQIGAVAGQGTAQLGDAVRKRGRSTQLTYGVIDGVAGTVTIPYETGPVTFANQLHIAPDTAHNPCFGDRGDSGSVLVNTGKQVVGLYFAGSAAPPTGSGWANPIGAVLSALQASPPYIVYTIYTG